MSHPPGTVLVVDDDQVNCRLLSARVKEQGHTVISVSSGRRALEAVAAYPVDAILLDLMMPGIDGFEVLARLKADPASTHIPVIVISSLDEVDSIVRCIEMGATDHLTKPVNPVLLRARLDASLAAKRLHDQEQEYLQQVALLTTAAADVQRGSFDPDSLAALAARPDELGRLADVFCRMVDSQRSRERDLQAQNCAKTALLSRVTHELRSPFVAAGFSVELLRRYAAHGMQGELAAQIDRLEGDLSAGRRMIDGMISFAALMSRRDELTKSWVNPEQLVREATAHLLSIAEARGVTIAYAFGGDLPFVEVDARRLGEAVAHLVHNGVKYNRPGGRVLVSARVAGDDLTVKVADTGRGFAAENLEQIWEPFWQAADDERRGVEGLGLGLPLVKQIVEQHGGEVGAATQPGRGSTFGFRIPVSARAPDVTAREVSSRAA